MASVRTRRRIATSAVAVMWFAAAASVVWVLFPLLRDTLALYRRVAVANGVIEKRINADLIPSEGVIKRYEDLQKAMIAEAEACAYKFIRHNESLDRKILESWRMNPYQLKFNFLNLKRKLADKAGNADFLEIGELDDWQKEDEGTPREEDFAAIEKRTCIAVVLVDLLATEPAIVIQLMEVHNPRAAAEAPPVPAVDWKVVRHYIYPVDIRFTTRFASLGKLLNLIGTVPAASDETPCMAVRKIKLTPTGSGRSDSVQVELSVDVYDFYRAERAS